MLACIKLTELPCWNGRLLISSVISALSDTEMRVRTAVQQSQSTLHIVSL